MAGQRHLGLLKSFPWQGKICALCFSLSMAFCHRGGKRNKRKKKILVNNLLRNISRNSHVPLPLNFLGQTKSAVTSSLREVYCGGLITIKIRTSVIEEERRNGCWRITCEFCCKSFEMGLLPSFMGKGPETEKEMLCPTGTQLTGDSPKIRALYVLPQCSWSFPEATQNHRILPAGIS